MNLRFDMYGQLLAGVQGHPQNVMRDWGITYSQAIPQSIADQWWFLDCENVPASLPDFVTELPESIVGAYRTASSASDAS